MVYTFPLEKNSIIIRIENLGDKFDQNYAEGASATV